MTIKDAIGECLVKMGKKDFSGNAVFSEEERKLLDELLAAMNVAYKEIVCNYLPMIHRQEVVSQDGYIYIDTLEKPILYPVSILSGGGEKVQFKTYPDKIAVGNSGTYQTCQIEYAYIPQEKLTEDDIISDMRLTPAMLSYGTLAQFYLANRVFELAAQYEAAFKNSVCFLKYKGRPMRMRQRGWQD